MDREYSKRPALETGMAKPGIRTTKVNAPVSDEVFAKPAPKL
jgi:hypothetical protein